MSHDFKSALDHIQKHGLISGDHSNFEKMSDSEFEDVFAVIEFALSIAQDNESKLAARDAVIDECWAILKGVQALYPDSYVVAKTLAKIEELKPHQPPES